MIADMRADRLVSILLMLQRRGQVTAAEVAKELEVSERTARRDLDALSASGIPVYAIQGRGGGWRLLGGARTDLSGLTASEVRALFLVAGPAGAATPAVRTALRKLVRALPEPFRAQAEATASSLIQDPHPWGSTRVASDAPRFLDVLQDAVIRGVQVRLGYVDRTGSQTERIVHPLGIVAKGRSWYLVAHTDAGQRTFRVDRVWSADQTDQPVDRAHDFDLAEQWRGITDDVGRRQCPVEVHATCAPEGLNFLKIAMGDNLEIEDTHDDGRIQVVIRGPSEYGLAGHLSGLVEWLEISSPQSVRERMAAIGDALVEKYR